MKRWIFAIFSMILVGFAANATINDGRVVTTVGYVTHEMDNLQNTIPAQNGTMAMTFGDDAGEIGAREVKSNLGTSTSDTSLPMVSAVNDKLDDKQDILPAKNTNTVLTYTGVEGSVGEKGIYQNSGTYAGQMDSLVTAGTFNAALKNGLDNEFVCAETDPATGQCWAYSINNNGGPWNYFNMDDIPERSVNNAGTVARNADGSITIDGGPSSSAVSMYRTLGQLAPGLEVGKSYKYSIKTTSSTKIMLLYKSGNNITWSNNTVKTITAEMLKRPVYFYTNGSNTTATISSIKITAVDSGAAVGATGTTILPDGYTPLEYIETTGTQWINTNLSPTNTTDFEIKLLYNDTLGTQGIIGYLNTNDITTNYYLVKSMYNNKFGFASGTAVQYISTNVVANTDYIYKLTASTFSINNESFNVVRGTSLSTTNKMYLLNRNNSDNASNVKCYYAKIWQDNTLVRNFIPAKRNSDGAIGMYDTVTNTFFTNAGTGDFIAGPVANNNLYIPQNQ